MVTASMERIALLALFLAVAGCASIGPPAPDSGTNESELGSLYVYHLSDSAYAKSMGVLALRRALIYVDDAESFSLPSGRHARVLLEPGFHTVYAKTSIYGGRLDQARVERLKPLRQEKGGLA